MAEEASAHVSADATKPIEEPTRPAEATAEPVVAEAKPGEGRVVATSGVTEGKCPSRSICCMYIANANAN
jgi:hypothetical protein